MNSLNNRTALITGSTDGIGKQTALGLAERGWDVVLTGRNIDKGNSMLTELKKINPYGNFNFYSVDFSSQKSIRSLADRINNEIPFIHVLINNVGLFTSKRKESVDGMELMLAVNYLSAFLFSNLLLEKLKKSMKTRIVNVTGGAYKFGKVNFEDLNHKKGFGSFKALGQAKLCNILFTYESERRWSKFGIHSIAVDPGAAKTPGQNEHSIFLLKWLLPLIGTSTKIAAYSSIEAATSSIYEGVGGIFLNKKGKPEESSTSSKDENAARELWEMSCKMVNISPK
ncbi:SDR family NAD(P)-dependent oxidoreductase [Aquiflexum sp.]|uniref:SDR family NAD(P)-dependent oxidoreductase n=1 Tax=Aquiflexum sp. TaxID=1872584 RepID=UPI003593F678